MHIEDLLMDTGEEKSLFRCIDSQGIWNADMIRKRVEALREVLFMGDVKKGEPVIVLTENGSAFLVGILGAMMAGAIAVPIDPQMPLHAVLNIISRVQAKIVCLSGKRPKNIFEGKSLREIKLLNEDKGEWECKESYNVTYPEYHSEEDNAFILFSSGTTGEPKGVVHTHKTILLNIDAIANYMSPASSDSFYIAKTMVHASTLTGEVLTALRAGSDLIALNPLVSPVTLLKRLEQYKPSILCVNPTILRILLRTETEKYDTTSIRLLYTSGAVADAELINGIQKKFPSSSVLNVYGMTEAGPRLTAQVLGDEKKVGSVGKAIKGVKVFIYDDDGNEVKQGETGNVCVTTECLMQGYWKDEKATKEKIHGNQLITGDLGYFDEDNHLYIRGRADDMIIRGGHNVDPNHVESVVQQFVGIEDCIVFGIPDILNGNRIICVYTSTEGMGIEKKKLLDYCAEKLAVYECPQELYCWEKLPKTVSGKLSRKLSVDQYNSQRKAEEKV